MEFDTITFGECIDVWTFETPNRESEFGVVLYCLIDVPDWKYGGDMVEAHLEMLRNRPWQVVISHDPSSSAVERLEPAHAPMRLASSSMLAT